MIRTNNHRLHKNVTELTNTTDITERNSQCVRTLRKFHLPTPVEIPTALAPTPWCTKFHYTGRDTDGTGSHPTMHQVPLHRYRYRRHWLPPHDAPSSITPVQIPTALAPTPRCTKFHEHVKPDFRVAVLFSRSGHISEQCIRLQCRSLAAATVKVRLTLYHAMETYWGTGNIAPCSLWHRH